MNRKKIVAILCLLLSTCVAILVTKTGNINTNLKSINNYVSTKALTNINTTHALTTKSTDTIELKTKQKSFLYHLGKAYTDDTDIYVTTSEKSINISQYSWYMVSRFYSDIYLADVFTNISDYKTTGVVSLSMYPIGTYVNAKDQLFDIDYSKSHILELLYVNQGLTECNKIIVAINDSIFNYINEISSQFKLSKNNTDPLSEILIDSFSFESQFKSSMYDNSVKTQNLSDSDIMHSTVLPNYGAYANSNETVALNEYDKYTDYDTYISEYESKYKDKVHKCYGYGTTMSVSDDPIVNIIPKSLFKSRGVYSYIGKEYGFFVKTVEDYGDDNYSDFLVFDIQTVPPFPGRMTEMSPPSITVRPLFTGTIRYITSWGNVVVYDDFYNPRLALANIRVTGAINNITENNIGDSNYVATQDYGYAFSSYAFETVGIGPDRDKHSINLGWAKTVIGATNFLNYAYPGVGTTVSVCGKALITLLELHLNHYYADTQTNFTYMDKLSDGTYKASGVVLGNSNTQTMINNYGNLIKGFNVELLNDDKNLAGFRKECCIIQNFLQIPTEHICMQMKRIHQLRVLIKIFILHPIGHMII